MTVELTQEQIAALIAILDGTVFRGSELRQALELYDALRNAHE